MNAGFGATLPSSNATATNLTIHEGRAAALVPFANAGFYQPAHKGR